MVEYLEMDELVPSTLPLRLILHHRIMLLQYIMAFATPGGGHVSVI